MTYVSLNDFQSVPMTHRAGELFNPPGLTNFWGNLQSAFDVMGFQHLTFPPYSQGESVIGALTVDQVAIATSGLPVTYRWRPDRLTREVEVNKFKITTVTVMGVQEQTAVVGLTVVNNSWDSRKVSLKIRTGGGVVRVDKGWHTPFSPQEKGAISAMPWEGDPPPEKEKINHRQTLPDAGGVIYSSSTSQAYSVQGTFPPPKSIEGGVLNFEAFLGAREEFKLYFYVGIGDDLTKVTEAFAAWRKQPDLPLIKAETDWQEEVNAVFTPNNGRYSGSLPKFHTDHADLKKMYLMTVIGIVYAKRTHPLSHYGRTYITLMPRYWVTTSFINDWSLSAYVLAMLDPNCVKKHIELWLTRDLYAHFGTEYVSGEDTGNWYSCNDFGMIRLISAYLRVTGDFAWVKTDKILDHVKRMALHYQALDKGHGLADCGGRNNLLEAVGSYMHEVASLNAANVWNLREASELFRHANASAEAEEFLKPIEGLIAEIQKLYVKGGGYWHCRYPDGTLVPVRHVWDFIHTMNFLLKDLPAGQVEEMVGFFKRELMTPAWMHALSPLDEDVEFSLRPDHQWNGSYPGWVAFACCALAEAGQWEVLKTWVPGLARAANQGPYAQAHFVETYAKPEMGDAEVVEGVDPATLGGALKAPEEWPYVNDWLILCVGGFYEFIVFNVFGVKLGYGQVTCDSRLAEWDPTASLEGLAYQGKLFQVNVNGVSEMGVEKINAPEPLS